MNKTFFKNLFYEILGSILIAAAIYNFAVQAEFPMTGFSGISLILYRLFNIPIGFSTIILNIPVAILCYKLLGRRFFFNSIRCMIISSIIIDYIAPLFPVYEGNRLLAAICTGVIAGAGYSLIYMQNSSTGGSDFIIMAIKALKPHLTLGNITFMADFSIVLIGGFIFKDLDGIIYGSIITYLMSVVMDKMIASVNSGKVTLIVTEHGQKICDTIDKCSQRGSTILHGQGGYQGAKKEVVMCACTSKDMETIQRATKKADPESFMIVMPTNEVHGEGFRMLQLGQSQNNDNVRKL